MRRRNRRAKAERLWRVLVGRSRAVCPPVRRRQRPRNPFTAEPAVAEEVRYQPSWPSSAPCGGVATRLRSDRLEVGATTRGCEFCASGFASFSLCERETGKGIPRQNAMATVQAANTRDRQGRQFWMELRLPHPSLCRFFTSSTFVVAEAVHPEHLVGIATRRRALLSNSDESIPLPIPILIIERRRRHGSSPECEDECICMRKGNISGSQHVVSFLPLHSSSPPFPLLTHIHTNDVGDGRWLAAATQSRPLCHKGACQVNVSAALLPSDQTRH